MSWIPISEARLWDHLNSGWDRMTPPERHFWDMIKIDPEKWQCSPWGDLGNGFWSVAIMGRLVIWYNDIEDGFNSSSYRSYGRFEDYWCDQLGLEEIVRVLKGNLDHGFSDIRRMGPPQPFED